VSYPQGFDGGGPVDSVVEARAGEFFADARRRGGELVSWPADCDALANSFFSIKGTATPSHPGGPGSSAGSPDTPGTAGSPDAPGTTGSAGTTGTPSGSPPQGFSPAVSKASSVLFEWEAYYGGAHSVFGYVSLNLRPDGKELAASDLFGDPSVSIPHFWAKIFREGCSGGKASAPSFYGSPVCSDAVPPLPYMLTPDATLDGMGHALLTPQGLTVSLDPYEAWSWAEGQFVLEISKEDLAGMGADTGFWQ
jgi:hypothetical protein